MDCGQARITANGKWIPAFVQNDDPIVSSPTTLQRGEKLTAPY